MAKKAKDVAAVDLGERRAKKFYTDIFDHLANIKTAQGVYANRAGREREGMTQLYESLTPFGISQKASKLVIKIAVMKEKIKGLQAELAIEERRQAFKLAKAIDDKQLTLMLEAPPAKSKAEKAADVLTKAADLEESESLGTA